MKNMNKLVNRPSRAVPSGLTMIEMLAVMGICGVMALILIPFAVKARANARTIVCADNLKGLGQAYAVCLFNSSGYLPDVYYTYKGDGSVYQINLRTPDTADTQVLTSEVSSTLVCPTDLTPRGVAVQTGMGKPGPAFTSYGYNVTLPVAFRNTSRVVSPVNTVTFYDGDVEAIQGEWQRIPGWQGRAIRLRHVNDTANYLYLDGHVERLEAFSDEAFNGTTTVAMRVPGDGGPVTTTVTLPHTTTTMPATPTTTLPPAPPPPTTFAIGGGININPANSVVQEFHFVLPDGFTVTRDHLHNDTCLAPRFGFGAVGLEYAGAATFVHVKPKGNGDLNGLTVNGLPYTLKNGNIYEFTSNNMAVHVFNDKRNGKGKAMGKWWIEINAWDVTIEVIKPNDGK